MATVTPHSHAQLLRVLGFAFGLAAVVGGMVGQGILRTPGIVAGAVHSPLLILLTWTTGALIVAITAFAYLELGTAIPCAGGPYDFVRRAFGSQASVAVGWGCWLILIIGSANLAIVVGEFMHRLGIWTRASTGVLAILVLALLSMLNWTGTRFAGASQILFSTAKGIILIGVVALLFAQPERAAEPPAPIQIPVGIAGIAIAMRVILSTYNGWQETVYFAEELKTPERTLPRSLAAGVAGVAILYLVINLALLHVLTPTQMAGSNLPAADAVNGVLGANGETAFTLFGIMSVAAVANLMIMKAARVSFALARAGQLPAGLIRVSTSGTPRPALAITFLLSSAFAASGTYETLIATNMPLNIALFLCVSVAAVRLRRTEPDLPRPFRIPLYPLPVAMAIAVNTLLLAALIYQDPMHSIEGFALLALIAAAHAIAAQSRKLAHIGVVGSAK